MCDKSNTKKGWSYYSRPESILKIGKQKTYDIQCEDPYHNFVANGIVIHNSGKSVLAQQIGFCADPTLHIDRICFTPDDFKARVKAAKKYECIIFDEAYRGLSSRRTMSSVNTALVQMFTEIRQKNLFIIIVMPYFFDMDKYAAIARSRILLHVYHNSFKRGFFAFYGYGRKKRLYLKGKKDYNYKFVKPNFRGKFLDFYVVDKKAYKDKKSEVFHKDEEEKKANEKKERITSVHKCLVRMIDDLKISKEYLREVSVKCGYSGRNLLDMIRFIKERLRRKEENVEPRIASDVYTKDPLGMVQT